MRSFSNLAFAVCLTGPLLAGHAAPAETLKLAGTGGAMPMAEQVAAGFLAVHRDQYRDDPRSWQQRRHRRNRRRRHRHGCIDPVADSRGSRNWPDCDSIRANRAGVYHLSRQTQQSEEHRTRRDIQVHRTRNGRTDRRSTSSCAPSSTATRSSSRSSSRESKTPSKRRGRARRFRWRRPTKTTPRLPSTSPAPSSSRVSARS